MLPVARSGGASVGTRVRCQRLPATAPLGKLGKQGRRGRSNLLTGLTASSARRADIHAPMVSFGRTLFVAMSYACPRWRLARAPSLQKHRAGCRPCALADALPIDAHVSALDAGWLASGARDGGLLPLLWMHLCGNHF